MVRSPIGVARTVCWAVSLHASVIMVCSFGSRLLYLEDARPRQFVRSPCRGCCRRTAAGPEDSRSSSHIPVGVRVFAAITPTTGTTGIHSQEGRFMSTEENKAVVGRWFTEF